MGFATTGAHRWEPRTDPETVGLPTHRGVTGPPRALRDRHEWDPVPEIHTLEARHPVHAAAHWETEATTQKGRAMTTATDELLRTTIDRVVNTGPSFLDGDIDADAMANTMVAAVTDHQTTRSENGNGNPPGDPRLQMAVREIYGCGAGYLAGRCDRACVARTISTLVNEFGTGA